MLGLSGKLRWTLLLLVIAATGTAVLVSSTRRESVDCVARPMGTNVIKVFVTVTRGSNHTFYYPSRLRWEWDRICKRMGVRTKSKSERIRSAPSYASDVLWVAMSYREKLPVLRLLIAEEADEEGRVRAYNTVGGLLDEKRRVSVTHWPLVGGAEHHRGKTIHIRTMSHGKEVARIEFR